MSFEPNRGQADPRVKFLSRGVDYTLFLTADEMVLSVAKPAAPGTVLTMKLLGAGHEPSAKGLALRPGKVHYLIGNDPVGWRTNIPTYAKVRYQSVYPGVDLVYYGSQGQLEYDFIVAPGADPRVIALSFDGHERLRVDARGDLVLHLAAGEVRFRKPVVYQEVNGVRTPVAGRFAIDGPNRVRFHVAAYDVTKPLVIDPALGYATLLGGSANDAANAVAVDGSGSAYVAGQTSSADFVGVMNAFKGGSKNNGATDAFVAKLAPNGIPAWVTYFGGTDGDAAYGIAVAPGCASNCNAFVTGSTFSADLPITSGAFSTKISGGSDAFVAKLTSTGNGLVYSSFLGGGGADVGHAIAVDSAGNAYVAGETRSSNFPFIAGPFASSKGKLDAFLAKLNASGSALLYSTYFGGTGDDVAYAIAVSCPFPSDPTQPCDAYVTGQTASNNLPTAAPAPASPFDTSLGGATDAFVAKMNTAGTGLASLTYSTYLGGSGADSGLGIALLCQPAGSTNCNALITGQTASANFPVVPAGRTFGGARQGSTDAFVTQLGPTGSSLVYSLFLGGSGNEIGYGIAVDANGHGFVTGQTDSTNFPTTTAAAGAYDTSNNGGADAFVTKLKADGSGLFNSTYLGGGATDAGLNLAFACISATDCAAYVAGQTLSADFPRTAGNTTFNTSGLADAFVAKLSMRVNTATALTSSPNPSTVGQSVTFTATVTDEIGVVPTGTVTFRNGGSVLGTQTLNSAGVATLTTSSLATGTPSITAEYGGDVDFNGSVSSPLTQTVNLIPTSTAISAPDVTFNANAIVTVTVSSTGGTTTGDVSLSVDGGAATTQPLVNGSTTFTLTAPAAGDHSLSASYTGQGAFANSSATGTLHVNAAATTTAITAPTVTFNANAAVTVTVSSTAGTPAGSVSLAVDGGAATSQTLVNGSTTFTLISPAAGDHSLVATYPAQGNFAGSSQTGSLHVNPSTVSLTVPGPQTVNEGQTPPLTFQVSGFDPFNRGLTFSATNVPFGAVFDPSTRTFSWTPNSAQGCPVAICPNGPPPYVVYFTVTDGVSFDTKSVNITVNDTILDSDNDGIPDAVDNCPFVYNPDQADVCHNSPEPVTASSSLAGANNSTNQPNLTITVTYSGGTNGTFVVPVNLFNTICRVKDGAGNPVDQGGVPEGPPINLSVGGDLLFVPGGTSQTTSTTFDLSLFFPNLVPGTYTVSCDYVNFAHIPQPQPDDPKIWKGQQSAGSLTFQFPLYAFSGFISPIPGANFGLTNTVPVKFTLKDSTGAFVSTCFCTLTVQQLDASGTPIPGTQKDAIPTNGKGNDFRYDHSNNQYIFNVSPKTWSSQPGPWQLQVHLDDGTLQIVNIVVTP